MHLRSLSENQGPMISVGKLNDRHAISKYFYQATDGNGSVVDMKVTSSVMMANGLKRILEVAVPRECCLSSNSRAM